VAFIDGYDVEMAVKAVGDGPRCLDAGAPNWGVIASLIETCKLNGVDLLANLADTLTAIVAGHKESQINDLLPWNYVK
jgi:hypothetical protein